MDWELALKENSAAYDLLRPRMTKYIRNEPFAKQRAFMCLPHKEAFYGGAAAGGKSDCLLMCALQYVDVPGYNALILRRTLQDADKAESILFRARRWLQEWPEVGWWPKQFMYLFPGGATLTFGYLDKKDDERKYDSAEYQFVGFDELTHFSEHQYEYLFSRLRGPLCPIHKRDIADGELEGCARCLEIGPLARVPLRMRSASNPGGPGHSWVRERFQIRAIEGKVGPTGKQLYAGTDKRRPHIPSFMDDNAYVDAEGYRESLGQMQDRVTYEQKEAGNWGIQEEGRFKLEWVRRYKFGGPYIILGDRTWNVDDQCYQFLMVDPASTVKDAPGGVRPRDSSKKSWSAIGRFLVSPLSDLCLLRMWRSQVEIPELQGAIRNMMQGAMILFVGMEYTAQSQHLWQMLCASGLPMKAMTTGGKDKIHRSGPLQNLMANGKYWLPSRKSLWAQTYEDELFSWTGDPDETDDQVDVGSYAAIYVTQEGVHSTMSLPEVY